MSKKNFTITFAVDMEETENLALACGYENRDELVTDFRAYMDIIHKQERNNVTMAMTEGLLAMPGGERFFCYCAMVGSIQMVSALLANIGAPEKGDKDGEG